jgi:hypothetical protein
MFKIKLRKYIMTIDGYSYERWTFIKAKNDLMQHLLAKGMKNAGAVILPTIRALNYIKNIYDGVPESENKKPEDINIKMGLDEPDIYYSVRIPMKNTDDYVFFTVAAKEISHV